MLHVKALFGNWGCFGLSGKKILSLLQQATKTV